MTDWRLAPRADRDLLDLYIYGAEMFGRTVARGYVDSLYACFDRLALNPRMGRAAETAGAELRRFEHRRHVLFYEIEQGGVRILAIVHERSVRGLDF